MVSRLCTDFALRAGCMRAVLPGVRDPAFMPAVPRHHLGWIRCLSGLLLIMLCSASTIPSSRAAGLDDNATALSVGRKIYRQGVLGSGTPLVGMRGGGLRLTGDTVACVNCHQRSGLGSREGQIYVPPISLRYLYFDPRHPSQQDLDLPYVEGMRITRKPYTNTTLARAIREGIGSDGRLLDYMMPHYPLTDADMAALIAYLGELDRHNARGVTHSVLHFATVITPDADPVKRQGMLAVLKRFFADKNMAPVGATPRLRSSRKFKFWVNPQWQLHVWQLQGPPKTWKAQLKHDLEMEPVFAVVSGLGGRNWAPVHAFCEEEELPCLFPNIEVPPADADRDFYSLYFSRGVLLEADLIANRLSQYRHEAATDGSIKVVRQIYRAGDSGEVAARALAAVLRSRGMTVLNQKLDHAKGTRAIAKAVQRAAQADVLVLWLRPADIAALGKVPPTLHNVFLSGLMAGLDDAPLPADWRKVTRLTYPVGLPAERRISVDFALGWFRIRHIPVVAERVQANTYLACGVLASTLHRMVDTFVPEYLMERIEGMLDDRLITGYFPHLTLAPDQRFASKGGYIVAFADAQGTRIVKESPWIVPQQVTDVAQLDVSPSQMHTGDSR